MALITCPDCKKKISDNATACPNCGFQLTPEKISKIKEDEKKARGSGCWVVIAMIIIIPNIINFFLPDTDDGNQNTNLGTRTSASATKTDAWVMAQQFVKNNLKSPGTASFGGLFKDYQNPDDVVTYLGNGKFRVCAWVDAQNSFGGKIRTYFVCELKYLGDDNWRLLDLNL